jgi:hypothetical protein
MRLQLFKSTTYPLFLNAWYERMTLNQFQLPPVELLMKSLNQDVTWPKHPYGYEVYYLENLKEQDNTTLLQVRFLPTDKQRDFISVFMSIDESVIQQITVHFSVRGDDRNASKMLEELKSVMHSLNMQASDVELLVEGFMEVGPMRFIREAKISGFVWVGEPLNRYIHISENPFIIPFIMRKGR